MTTKLTLSVEADIVRRAKRHARAQGTSLSSLVSRFLALVPARSEAPPMTRSLRNLRGSLKTGDQKIYRRHLREKHL